VIKDYVMHVPRESFSAFSILSKREREVLQLLAEGSSAKEIASLLFLSIKTVETHRKNIMEKLDLHSIAELTKYAIREGITSLDS
jgi:DNA-binding NarL/FixJ family response regulator